MRGFRSKIPTRWHINEKLNNHPNNRISSVRQKEVLQIREEVNDGITKITLSKVENIVFYGEKKYLVRS